MTLRASREFIARFESKVRFESSAPSCDKSGANFESSANIASVKTNDGSFSAYNAKYGDYYHGIADGAMLETIYKHIIPAFFFAPKDSKIRILDICFGLGYNSLFSLIYAKKLNLNVEIFSPEFDLNLLKNLKNLKYPRILENNLALSEIFESIKKGETACIQDSNLSVIYGDAREVLGEFQSESFDIIFQDAFSPKKNAELWDERFFIKLARILKNSGIITTYSSAKNIRQNAINAGLIAHDMKFGKLKNGSVFAKRRLEYTIESAIRITPA